MRLQRMRHMGKATGFPLHESNEAVAAQLVPRLRAPHTRRLPGLQASLERDGEGPRLGLGPKDNINYSKNKNCMSGRLRAAYFF